MPNESVLIVDDERGIVQVCSRVLEREGYAVQAVGGGQEALDLLSERAFDLLLVDINLPGIDGLQVLRRARELDANLTALVITGYATMEVAIQALHAGARGFLLKPFDGKELLSIVQDALAQKQREEERQQLRAQLPILQIGQALAGEGNVVYLARRLLDALVSEVGVDRAALFLLDESGNFLHLAGGVGLQHGDKGSDIPVRPGTVERELLLRNELLLLDEDEARWCGELLGCSDVVHVLLAPLRTVRRQVGLLCLGRLFEGLPFSPSEQNLLSIIAGQMAIVLENAALYKEVRETRDYLRTVRDSLQDEVVAVGRDHRIVDVNARFLQRTGLRREDVVGQPCQQIAEHLPCRGQQYECLVQEVWESGQPVRSRCVHHEADGQSLYMDVTASPLCDAAGQVVQVIETYHDVTTEQHLQEKLDAIHRLGQELVLSRDEDHVIELVMDAAERLLQFQRSSLWLLGEESQTLNCRIWHYEHLPRKLEDMPVMLSLPLSSERGIVAAVARSGQAIYLPDVGRDERFIDAGLGTRSELCVPLKVGDRLIGVFNAESERLEAFGPGDRRLFSTLADQAALAIDNARLLTETQHRLQQVRTLLEVSRDVATQLDLPTLLASILRAAVRGVPAAERGSILRLETQTGQFVLAAQLGYEEDFGEAIDLSPESSFAGWVCERGRADIVHDTRQDERFVVTASSKEIRSIMSAPLLGRRGLVGVINLDNLSEALVFDQHDLEFLSGLADHVAMAIENAQLYQAVTRGKQEWEQTFDAIADGISLHDTSCRIVRVNRALAAHLGKTPQELVGCYCYRELYGMDSPAPDCPGLQTMQSGRPIEGEYELPYQQGIFHLSWYPLFDPELDRHWGVVRVQREITQQKRLEAELVRSEKLAALGRLVASLAHEINNPLQALRSGLHLLVRRHVDEEKRQKYLQVADREVERLIAIVERVLGFYRPSSERPQPTDVNAILEETLILVAKRLEHGGVVLESRLQSGLPRIEALPDQLKQVFLNLSLNALQSMPRGGRLLVETGFNGTLGEIYLSFTDTGEGISEEMQSRLFEPFSTNRTEGTGLGLAISYGIVERHGGRIEVESEIGVGSTFTIWLPMTSVDSWPKDRSGRGGL
ncbi:MAG: GAF domain-containing protein [Chloroflexia bacterium]|nr:GAF domain-containing protein [Chloroflexia bacterium]